MKRTRTTVERSNRSNVMKICLLLLDADYSDQRGSSKIDGSPAVRIRQQVSPRKRRGLAGWHWNGLRLPLFIHPLFIRSYPRKSAQSASEISSSSHHPAPSR